MEQQENAISRRTGRALAAVSGWRIGAEHPLPDRCVVIAAHHTSNWDFLALLLYMLCTGVRFQFVAKDSLFRGPAGWILHKLGGVPVNRRSKNNFVEQMVARFQEGAPCRLLIVPKGTRHRMPYWRTGFYYIAQGAQVPVVLAYVDYRRKEVGPGPMLIPSGDLETDMGTIRRFYAGITGLHPHLQGEIRLRADVPLHAPADPAE